ncbi:MAG: Lactose transport system permease protein LacF [Chloroflexi bacterium]|nr:Lactose transport system permease protein LacF [Chloroflexota bacterium]
MSVHDVANAKKRKQRATGFSEQRTGRAFLAPTVIILLALTILPFLLTIILSFSRVTFEGGGIQLHFAGLANWSRLFADERLWNAFSNTLILVVFGVSVQFLIGLGLALLVNGKIKGQGFFKVLFLLPMLLAPISVGYMGRMMFDYGRSPINDFLNRVGLEPIGWLISGDVALLTILLTDTWQWTPVMFLILLVGLQAIPKEYVEAASIDGATGWQLFRHITLPLLASAVLVAILFRTVEAFKVVDIIVIMTGGGPGLGTESMTLFAYIAGLRIFDIAYGAAISLTLFIPVLLGIGVFLAVARRYRASTSG